MSYDSYIIHMILSFKIRYFYKYKLIKFRSYLAYCINNITWDPDLRLHGLAKRVVLRKIKKSYRISWKKVAVLLKINLRHGLLFGMDYVSSFPSFAHMGWEANWESSMIFFCFCQYNNYSRKMEKEKKKKKKWCKEQEAPYFQQKFFKHHFTRRFPRKFSSQSAQNAVINGREPSNTLDNILVSSIRHVGSWQPRIFFPFFSLIFVVFSPRVL